MRAVTSESYNTHILYCLINPFERSVAFHIEISHLICTENQMNGFYMKCNTGLKWVKGIIPKTIISM